MDEQTVRPSLDLLLAEIGSEPERWNEVLPRVYDELVGLAGKVLGGRSATLDPTGLVHEAWERLRRQPGFSNREHFLAVAAIAMRTLLVDRARAAKAQKRGGDADRITLHSRIADEGAPALDLLDLHEALEALAKLDERQARVVELRIFAGLGIEEIAQLLDTSRTTVKLAWRTGRAWLRGRMLGGESS